jgi:hypothetical protein
MVVEHNWRGFWRHPLRALRDAPPGGHCGDTMKIDGSEPIIDIPPHLSRHANGIRQKQWFYIKELRKKVRKYDTTWP